MVFESVISLKNRWCWPWWTALNSSVKTHHRWVRGAWWQKL